MEKVDTRYCLSGLFSEAKAQASRASSGVVDWAVVRISQWVSQSAVRSEVRQVHQSSIRNSLHYDRNSTRASLPLAHPSALGPSVLNASDNVTLIRQ